MAMDSTKTVVSWSSKFSNLTSRIRSAKSRSRGARRVFVPIRVKSRESRRIVVGRARSRCSPGCPRAWTRRRPAIRPRGSGLDNYSSATTNRASQPSSHPSQRHNLKRKKAKNTRKTNFEKPALPSIYTARRRPRPSRIHCLPAIRSCRNGTHHPSASLTAWGVAAAAAVAREMASEAKDVGILAMDIYFPPNCVLQEELETHDGVSKGKYTIGLGQDSMAFCTEAEDVISMSLTVVKSLLKNYNIDPMSIGRLEVGSETVIDKSKSIKTWLMQIFEECGNTDIEGVDSSNACYGGTAALFNCVNWVESNSWDGRYGLVVCTDSAVYAEGPARPTGGAAAIAMLIGPNAPFSFESKYRGSHMAHVYDFYKPDLASEYPVVDGKLSQTCYLMALDSCYNVFCKKYEKLEGKQFSIFDADYVVFHSPYNKLVQKSFARLCYNDFLRNCSTVDEETREKLAPFAGLSSEESYQSRDLEKASQQVAKKLYESKVQPTTLIPKQVGNMYTASLYAAFASVIHNRHETLAGQRIVMFSYGSGLTSTMFSFKINEGQHPFSLLNIANIMDVSKKLEARYVVPPNKFVEALKLMEHRYGAKDFVTSQDTSLLASGTYYLTHVDSMYRRFYAVKGDSVTSAVSNGH
ncbi:hypothetical protein EJB05_08244 [Eragrostis curvula]|uniref:Hydroxymethylglutaryl-CoA synthase n=1 Tax=Eragrostis curvula TaxID=38414 RepID=A0A5J9WKI6_9POAL|nr:hypothetical protein EJB05_08244 [Eragrostis curvula]